MIFEAAIGGVFLLFGTGFLIWTAWDFGSALLSRGWPRATATIVASYVRRSEVHKSEFSYRPDVTYCYSVQGKEFLASRVAFGAQPEFGSADRAARTVQRYRTGARVIVRYNPHDPQEAVLQPGINGWVFAGAALGVLFTAVGILALRSLS